MRERDEGLALSWALRRYAGLIVGLVVGSLLLALFVAYSLRREVGYTANALVIAKQLTVRQEQLPRFGESVFKGGSVARAVAGTDGTDYRTLVPERISMDPVPDTIAFRVQGHSKDAQEAARLANTAADAFVVQLNKAGAGVGAFALQDPAYVPLERDISLVSYPLAALVGLAGGSTLAAALVALLVGVRRPVLDGETAAQVVGGPLLAVVTVPKKGTSGARGMRSLLEVLPALPSSAVELVGPTRSEKARRTLLAQLPLAQKARTAVPGPHRRRVLVTDLMDETSTQLDLPTGRSPLEGEALAAVVVVVQEGAARRAVADVVGDFPPEEVAGAVFVRRRRRLRPEPVAVPDETAVEFSPPARAQAPTPGSVADPSDPAVVPGRG